MRPVVNLKLFTVFHLNLAYSSIEEAQRAEVVERCYWPLLRLARDRRWRIGLEAPGFTLETIDAIDSSWTAELRALLEAGQCEFVGSGQTQLIGPLVPAGLNAANLRLGHQTYERLLGRLPRIALVSEQAFSAGLVPIYLDAGYEALVMEWDNPASAHPGWPSALRYLPQQARGPDGERIALLWNQSIAFQKFQRYAHGDLELAEYLPYLVGHVPSDGERAFALYGNDAEVFDFRPGRYGTEAVLDGSEWERIDRLFAALAEDARFDLVRPSDILALSGEPGAGSELDLTTAAQPVPVKKQAKYNLTRWAVTGRDDIGCNTRCWRIYEALQSAANPSDDAWRELCFLWSSDFRTHITEKRWQAFSSGLGAALAATGIRPAPFEAARPQESPRIQTRRAGRYLDAAGENVGLRLNCRRGLAIDALRFGPPTQMPQVGTLGHGHYEDISLGADFYSGHLVLEMPGRPKVTDLSPVEPEIHVERGILTVRGTVTTPLGPVHKTLRLWAGAPRLEIEYELEAWPLPQGSLRLGYVTLLPEAFDQSGLVFRTRNGGRAAESFSLAGTVVDHGAPASPLVSASQGVGMTSGEVVLGDERTRVRVEIDKCAAAGVGLVTYREVGETFFCRLAISLRELDETCLPVEDPSGLRLRMAITPG